MPNITRYLNAPNLSSITRSLLELNNLKQIFKKFNINTNTNGPGELK